MNPRQRRGVALLVVAAVGAGIVLVTLADYVGEVRSRVGPMTTVLELRSSAGVNQEITPDMVRPVQVPRRWAPRTALSDPDSLVGNVAVADMPAGLRLQRGMLSPPPALEAGQRELTILVGADTGVAGRIQAGDYVDIAATFSGGQDEPPRSQILVPRARIVGLGLPERVTRRAPGRSDNAPPVTQERLPVTFALTPPQTLVVTYAESFANEVRLVLTRRGDRGTVPPERREYQLPPPARRPVISESGARRRP